MLPGTGDFVKGGFHDIRNHSYHRGNRVHPVFKGEHVSFVNGKGNGRTASEVSGEVRRRHRNPHWNHEDPRLSLMAGETRSCI